ncbi:hypothetical protein ACFQ09_20705 [Massilia norwichensis]|jgi:hypothetical protein|uniref:ZIP family metal transporter n=1 Tax=Massilia norwichensis TaxID=1442366 RepID=A0ABT2A213_9BURK|nr:hypothetical protein [Massilia norwichensis]MCS0588228.1 hypothetical protein [Massilia norwichensis]
MLVYVLVATAGLILVHLFGAKLKFLEGTPRSIWLSSAGGISVAYVFIHLLPELAEGQEVIRKSVTGIFKVLDQHAYLMALGGLIIFYGLERAAKESHAEHHASDNEETPDKKVFWLHITSFSIYNVLIGYLLANNFRELKPLIFFFVAMALHFLVTDFGLRSEFKNTYHTVGRWILTIAVAIGTAVGLFMEVPEVATSALVAILAGGVILNVLKEELPEERRSRFTPFLLGALAYAALLLAF